MSHSHTLFRQAQRYIPGGVNSPVRAFKAVGGTPIFFNRASGPYLFDADERRYIDYVLSWGPMILGHAHPTVVAAVTAKLSDGLSFGAPTEIETQLAQRLCERVPNMELVRFVNSGTEATMSAIRLARGVTQRDNIVKFEGCYHGHSDSLLVKAGSGALTLGVPSSPGVPASLADHTITLTYNDAEQVKTVFQHMGEQIAAIIVEPVAGNMNCVPPLPGFLQTLREVCDNYGAILIFDEVMTGLRVAAGGAQQHYRVNADLITLGKVIGGGMPVGAFGGKRTIMQQIAPLGPIYQAGTLSGNPIAMAAGIATLDALFADSEFYPRLFAKTTKLLAGLQYCADKAGIPFTTNAAGSMFGFFFTEEKNITHYRQVIDADSDRFNTFFHQMLAHGVYFAPASYEAGFMSIAHSSRDITTTLEAAGNIFSEMARVEVFPN